MFQFAKKTLFICTILGVLFIGSFYISPPNHVAHAVSTRPSSNHYCQCVEFVWRYYHLSNSMMNYSAGSWIQELPVYTNWRRDPNINIGDIVVWPYSQSMPSGHVGVVSGIQGSSQFAYIIVLAANQYGSTFTELTCNDVSYVSWDISGPVYFHRT